MRIDWQQSLEGLTALQIRDLLRRLPFINSPLGVRFVEQGLARMGGEYAKGRGERARRIIDGLMASGLIEPDPESGKYLMTDTGVSLRAARATKRFKRARAEKAVAAMLETAKRINADPLFLHDVEWIAAFGSYITDAPDLGDIDIAITLKARWTPYPSLILSEKTDRMLMADKFEELYPPPESFALRYPWRFWPEVYTRRMLKTDTAMAVIEGIELQQIGCPYRVIFPRIEDVPAQPGWAFEREEVVFKPAV